MKQVANENGAQSANQNAENNIGTIENMAEFMGTVSSAPDVKEFDGGRKLTKVNIRISEAALNNDGSRKLDEVTGEQMYNTEFIEVQGWGKTGEKLAAMAKPYTEYKAAREAGDENARAPRLIVSGELKQDRWMQDEQTRSKVVLVANSVDSIENAKGHYVNRVVLKGNLTRDTETKEYETGGRRINNSLAVNKEYDKKNGEHAKETSYFNITGFGDVAGMLKSTKKGDFIQIDGKLCMDTWEQDGKKHSMLKIIPKRVNIISRNKDREAKKAFAPKQSKEKSEGYSR